MAEALSNSDDAAPTLIVEAASPCKILVANPAWCALMGYRPEDVAGQPISLLHGPLTCGETLTALGMSMGAGQSLRTPRSPRQFGAMQLGFHTSKPPRPLQA